MIIIIIIIIILIITDNYGNDGSYPDETDIGRVS